MSESTIEHEWVRLRPRSTRPRVRLFCLPYAGSGSAVFHTWPEHAAPDLEICPIQLPGREASLGHPAFRRLSDLVDALIPALAPFLNAPFAFFGHSMGALIAFESIRGLRRRGMPGPLKFFASGHRAPHLPNRQPQIHDIPREKFVREIEKLDGTPDTILNSTHLDAFLSVLRADFALCETYTYTVEPRLECPITALGGLYDYRLAWDELDAWRAQTTRRFNLRMFPGNHFYLHGARADLLDLIETELTDCLTGAAP